MELYCNVNGAPAEKPSWSIDQLFNYGVRYQVLCKTQEEVDELQAYQLLYSRELDVQTFDQWKLKQRMSKIKAHYGDGKQIFLLPIVFTTFPAGSMLRGI